MAKHQLENAVRRGAVELLRARGYFVSIVTNRGIRNEKGAMFFHGTKGLPDLVAIRYGHVIAVECKTKTGRQSAAQKVWQAQWRMHGGEYIIWRDVEDCPK